MKIKEGGTIQEDKKVFFHGVSKFLLNQVYFSPFFKRLYLLIHLEIIYRCWDSFAMHTIWIKHLQEHDIVLEGVQGINKIKEELYPGFRIIIFMSTPFNSFNHFASSHQLFELKMCFSKGSFENENLSDLIPIPNPVVCNLTFSRL